MSKRSKVIWWKMWIALSDAGHPCPTTGIAFTRRALQRNYHHLFGHSMAHAGYVPTKVWVRKFDLPRDESSR
jgi:hypothetical protein